jgi:hypothetical protein
MKGTRHSEEQIIAILQQGEAGFLVRRSPHHQRLALALAVLWFLPPNHQPPVAIDPMDSLVVHGSPPRYSVAVTR